ncbi:MAG: hypothetical protein IKI64_05455 [Clostridia bacterium]|nr:hypothetical protein [Clostridia bacterium]
MSKRIRSGKSPIKKLLIGVLVLLSAAVLFFGIGLLTLPRLDPNRTYKGREYCFIGGRYGTSLDHLAAKTDKAVARFSDAVIYTLKDDPDEFYLSPRLFLAHLPYNALGRRDMMQLPSEENVDHIEVGVSNGEDIAWSTPDPSVQHALLEAYGKSTIRPEEYEGLNLEAVKERWRKEDGCEVLEVRLWFKKPNTLYYELLVIKRGSEYFLLLEDGSTLIELDGDLMKQ